MTDLFLTVDLEPDCPPYLSGWKGMEEGAPELLDLLEGEGVPATFFTTGDTADRFPSFVDSFLEKGHELGCHGQTHTSFASMTRVEAEEELERSTEILRRHEAVTAFRAPYLRFPEAYLPLLEGYGYRLDASRSRYKPIHWSGPPSASLRQLPASTTSSVLRLPPWIRDPLLAKFQHPVVLFVHPWEFVAMRGEAIPWDSRLGTGDHALHSLREVIGFFRERGARFRRVSEFFG